MAVGDQADIVGRIRAALPSRWFPLTAPGQTTATPVLDGLLAGLAWAWAWLYGMIAYANLQTRIVTATDVWLDITAQDFFGLNLPRALNEGDGPYRLRIAAAVLQPKATRAALAQAVFALTGRQPVLFEPGNPSDTGGYSLGGAGYGSASTLADYRPSIGTFVGSNGLVQTAGWHIPRYDYTTGSAVLLNEASATNLLFDSANIASGNWTRFGTVTATANAATAPDGTTTAAQLTMASGGNGIYQQNHAAVTAGATYTVSVWLRATAAVNVDLVSNTNLSDPVSRTAAVTTAWQRFSLSKTLAAGSTNLNLQIDSGVGGFTVYAWGAQIELGAAATSYIATTNAVATRAADLIYTPGAAGGYGNLSLPFQVFVTAYRPSGGGIATVGAYGNATFANYGAGGYGVGAIEYASTSMVQGQITDAMIQAIVTNELPAASIAWLRISN